MIETMISINDLEFAKLPLSAPLRQNLSQAERRALRSLKNNTDIVIKKADKGSAIVIMDRDDYIKEGERQLNDKNFYRHVNEDMTHKFNDTVKSIVSNMVKNKEITEEVGEFLIQEKPRTSQFYLLPKIHKKNCKIHWGGQLYQQMIAPRRESVSL